MSACCFFVRLAYLKGRFYPLKKDQTDKCCGNRTEDEPTECTQMVLCSWFSLQLGGHLASPQCCPHTHRLAAPLPAPPVLLLCSAFCAKQGNTFTSWEDVFPDVEAKGGGSEGVAAEPTGTLLETDSDDSDDESFKVGQMLADRTYALTR